MSRRDNPVKTYLTDKENAKLERWSKRVDKSKSELLRQAVLEYTDRDRVERVEHEVREVNDKLDRVLTLVDGEHTHTGGGQTSVPEKARSIARDIYRKHEAPYKNENVEIEIENVAGADDRTVEKYKSQMKKRELLFEHPVSEVWTDETAEWVQWVENTHVNPDVHEVTQEYGISTTEYTQLAEQSQ